MRPLVIDASAAIALLRGEPGGDRVEGRVRERVSVIVPWFFWLEVVNALMRRHRQDGPAVMESIYDLEQLGLQTRAPDRVMLLATIDAAEARGLTAYDAAYLALALEADADLLTGDADLAAAAGERAILFGPGSHPDRVAEARARYTVERRVPDWARWPGAAAYLEGLRQQVMAELAAEGDRTSGR